MGDTYVQMPPCGAGGILVLQPKETTSMHDENSRTSVSPGFVMVLAMGAMLVALASMDKPVQTARVFVPGATSSEMHQQGLASPCSPVWSRCEHRNPV
jgi:hypothetical protein